MKVIEAIPHDAEADTFNFQVSLATLRQAVISRKWVVVAITLLTIALVVLYIWAWPATYEVELMISADSDKDTSRTNFYQGWNTFRRDALADEAALMTAAPVLKDVAQRLDLKYADVYHPFMSYLTHLWTESWVGKNYRKVKLWIFPKKPSPYDPSPEEVERYKMLTDFKEGVKLAQVKDASIGLLIVRASNQRVAEIANTIANVYLEQRRDRFVQEAQEAHKALRDETEKAQEEMDALDREVKQFRAENGLLLAFEKDRVQLGQYQTQRAVIGDLEAAIADNENALKVVNRQLASESEAMGSDRVFKDTAVQDRLTKLEIQLAHAKQLFQPTAPEVRELEEQIRIASASIDGARSPGAVRNPLRVGESYEVLRAKKNAIESTLAGSAAALQAKRAELERVRALVERLPEKVKVSQDYDRKQSILETRLRVLSDKLSIATVSLATARSAPSALRVVDYAVAPEQPVWPKTKYFILGAILSGLLLGVSAALLLESVFVRVNRHRLWDKDEEYRLFAIVDRDEKFLNSLYALDGAPRLPAPLGQT